MLTFVPFHYPTLSEFDSDDEWNWLFWAIDPLLNVVFSLDFIMKLSFE